MNKLDRDLREYTCGVTILCLTDVPNIFSIVHGKKYFGENKISNTLIIKLLQYNVADGTKMHKDNHNSESRYVLFMFTMEQDSSLTSNLKYIYICVLT